MSRSSAGLAGRWGAARRPDEERAEARPQLTHSRQLHRARGPRPVLFRA
jgi:hypothetical protein